MKRFMAWFLLLAFSIATELAPVLHKLEADKDHAGSSCEICKVANSPMLGSESACPLRVVVAVVHAVSRPSIADTHPLYVGIVRARGPPLV
jgi:hypothetical protein